MNIFDPSISGSLSVSGSGQISGDLSVLGTLYATVSGTTQNSVSASHAASYTLTSSFHQFTSSYTTGSFTGSFIGNGAALYNIPASGVTGLNLSQISDGTVTASLSQANGLLINTNTEITGNLTVTGRLTAQEYHTELVSASIIYESGSSKFGDSLDDVHQITGSVDVSGSLEVNNIVLGTDRLVTISVSDAGGKYFIDNVRNPTLTLIKGYTYKFLFPNIGAHPFRFSTTNDGTHNGGVAYTTGVTIGSSPDYIQIEVTDTTPSTLYYFCTSHTGMGNSISVLGDILNNEADRNVVYIEPSRIATTGSNTFVGTETISGSLSVTGSVDITGSITLNGQAIGTGKLDETVFNSYTSSNNTRVSGLETSTGSLNSFTSSINTTIKNKMNTDGVVSGSIQINITGVTGYSTFSSSIATTDFNQESRLSAIETSTGSLNTFSSSTLTRLSSLETESGSIRTDFNTFTSSYTTVSSSLDSRLDVLEAYSGSQQVPTASFSFRTAETSVYCKNSSGYQINKGQVVRIVGSVGDNPLIATASYENDANSANTLGVAKENIPNDSFGMVITEGVLLGVDTLGMTGGDLLYLGANGSFTTVSPTAPLHGVRLGEVLRVQQNNGSIYVRIDNGIELNEAHDVAYTSISSGDLLVRSGSVWINSKQLTGSYHITGSINATSLTGSIDYNNLTNVPTLVSGSSQILLTGTTGYSTFSSSIATTTLNIETRVGSLETESGSVRSTLNSYTSSNDSTNTTQNNRLTSLEGKTGSYATTGSNVFQGTQTITGSLYISQDLIVAGSSSIQNISSSIVNIADNIITVNALNPSVRFGGLAVIDSGSSPQVSGSMLFDSVNNQWLFVHQNQSTVTSSVLLMGPETFNNLGNEGYLSQNRIPKGTGIEHLNDSNITDTGTIVSINSNTEVTGTLVVTQNISSPNITAIQTATGSLNSFTSSVLAAIELTGSNLTVKGNLLVKGTTTNVNVTTLDVDNNLINLNGTGATSAGLRVKDTTSPNQVSGSLLWDATNDYWIAGQLGSEQRIVRETEFSNAVTRIGNVETSTGSLNSFTSSINTTIKSKLNSDGVISGSSQVNHNATTNYDANQHVDHTSVSITAGSGLSGGGTIASTRTITLDTGSVHFLDGVKKELNTEGVVSGSSQISFTGISNRPALVSGSAQISFNGITDKPALVSGSSQISFNTISDKPTLVSGSSQITYSGISGIPSGIVSGSAQLTSTFVQKTGDTMTGQLVIGSTGSGNAATLKINTSTAASFIHSQENFSANMTAGQANILVIGASGTTKNSGYIGYNWAGAGSNSNYVSIGHWGNDHLFRVYGDGTVYMGTVTTGVWNGSSISTTYTAAKVTAVNAGTGISVDTTTGSVTVTNTGTLTVAGTSNQVLVNGGTAAANGNITLSLPQSINTGASPTFAGLTINGGATTAIFRNATSTSNSNVQMGNDSTTNGAGIALLGSAFSASGQYRANGGYIYSNLSGGLTLHAEGNNSMYLATSGSTAITINSSQVATFANTINGSINGTVTKTISSGNHENFLYANVGSDDYVRIRTGADSYNAGYLEIATADDGTEPIYVRQYNGIFSSIARTATLLDGSGNTTFPGTITAYSGRRVAMSNSTTFSNVSSVSFTHNLGTANLTAQVFDSSDNMFFPSEINITSTTVTVTFATNRTGRLVVTG